MKSYTVGLLDIADYAPPRHEDKRRCENEDCGTILNRYNTDTLCSRCRRRAEREAEVCRGSR